MITINTQPTASGFYSCYFPIEFKASESGNPDFLYFTIQTSAGLSTGIPTYKAPNINNVFEFDASSYLQSYFNIRSEQGLGLTALEELTDVYGNFKIYVNTDTTLVGGISSNSFYVFNSLDPKKYLNNQTANNVVSGKCFFLSNDVSSNYFPPKRLGNATIVNIYSYDVGIVGYPKPQIRTYNDEIITNTSSVVQIITLSSFPIDKLISIPLTPTYLQAFLGGTTLLPYKSLDVRFSNYIQIFNAQQCNMKEFIFINRYGVKENLSFKSYDFEEQKTSSQYFRGHGFDYSGNAKFFNSSANQEKINQEFEHIFEIKGQRFTRAYSETIQDFLRSPKHWIYEDDVLKVVTISDGTTRTIDKSKGQELNFKYQYSQKQLAFK